MKPLAWILRRPGTDRSKWPTYWCERARGWQTERWLATRYPAYAWAAKALGEMVRETGYDSSPENARIVRLVRKGASR